MRESKQLIGCSIALCAKCGAQFKRSNSQLAKSGTHFCSALCWSRHQTANALVRNGFRTKRADGHRRTKLYGMWLDMRRRCGDPNGPSRKYYYGKGISVCGEWSDFGVFRSWVCSNLRPMLDEANRRRMSIDRIDSDWDYCPENCQIIPLVENCSRAAKKANVTRYGGGGA